MVSRRLGAPVAAGEVAPAAGDSEEAVVVVVGAAQAANAATESDTASSVEFHLRIFSYLLLTTGKMNLLSQA
jgi:hypothetical protein